MIEDGIQFAGLKNAVLPPVNASYVRADRTGKQRVVADPLRSA
ncbi:hypothetical protein [Paenibacillus sp. PvR148]